jgi:hypothetical protein
MAHRPLDLQPDGPHRDTRLSPTEHERQEVNRAIHWTVDRQCYGLHGLGQQMATLATRISSRITTEAIFIGRKVVRLQRYGGKSPAKLSLVQIRLFAYLMPLGQWKSKCILWVTLEGGIHVHN